MATALPPIADLTGAAITEAQGKTWFTNLRAFLADTLGTLGTLIGAHDALKLLDPRTALNLQIAPSVGSSALTLAVQTNAAANASATDPIRVGMRSATLTSGAFFMRAITAALSLVVPSTATLGHTSAVASPLHFYLIDYASGTIELAVSSTFLGESGIATTTAIAGASNSATILYSTTARTAVPFRWIGSAISTQATAGTWAAVPVAMRVDHAPAGTPSRVTGLTGVNNSGTPATQFDLACTSVTLTTVTGESITIRNPASLTNNLSTASARGGRDQAGAFSAGFVHLYYTWDGITLSTRSSVNNQLVGPVLANGEFAWAYATTLYFTSGTTLVNSYARGSEVFYKGGVFVNLPSATGSYQSVSLTAVIPSNALCFNMFARGAANFANNDWASVALNVSLDGSTNLSLVGFVAQNVNNANPFAITGAFPPLPNVGQTIYGLLSATLQAGSSLDIDFYITSYKVPNGDS